MKVAGYCRVSTQEQAVNGTSTDSQKISIENECKKLNYHLVALYIDDGVSGKDDDRPELNRLRADALLDQFDCVMFTKLDRLGRNMRDLSNIAYELKQSKTNLYCIDEPYINDGGLMFNIFGTFAEFERETIKSRTDLGKKIVWKSQTSVIGSLPFGYKKVNGKAEIDDQNAAIYNLIITMYLEQNYSMKDIAVKLTLDGIPLPCRSTKNTSRHWSTSTISDILKNEAYTGETFQNKYIFERRKSAKTGKSYSAASKREKEQHEWVRITFPPLITKDRFDQIQRRIQLQKKKPKKHHLGCENNFIAENTLYCGYCGTKLRKIITREGKLKYTCHWSYCSKKELFLSKRSKCILRPIDADDADNRIFYEVSEMITDPGRFAQDWLRNTNIEELRNKVYRLEQIESTLREELREGFKQIQKTKNIDIKKTYEKDLRTKEEEFGEVQNNHNIAKKELSFAESKLNHLSDFQNKFADATKRKKFGIYFSTKSSFMEFINNLPQHEKKRILEAVISQENGGKYFVRHPTLDDIADDTRAIPICDLYNPIPEKGHVLDGVYSIDLDRIQSVIRSLNYVGLLDRHVP